LHIIPREFIVDSEGGINDPVGMSGTRLEVDTHIISATTTALQNLVKCIQNNGLGVDDIVFVGWASSQSVLTDTEKELGVTLLDIGGGTTSVSIFQEGAISYSGCIPLGGLNITSDLAIGLQISLEDAEKLKVNFQKLIQAAERGDNMDKNLDKPPLERKKEKEDEEEKSKKDEDSIDISSLNIKDHDTLSKSMYKQIVEARLDEIFEMVNNQVTQAGFDCAMPAGVVVTGGSASLYEITQTAQKSFGVPSRIGTPSGLTGMTEEISSPAFAACQGLILHGMVEDLEPGSGGALSRERGSGGEGVVGGLVNWVKSLLP
jgi:cell division protein FtsA